MKPIWALGLTCLVSTSGPVMAQGLVLNGANQSKILSYHLQEGNPRVKDRYYLTLRPLPFPTRSLQILYFPEFDGQINGQKIIIKSTTSDLEYPVAQTDVDRSARAITIQMLKPLPKGETIEVLFDEVVNPESDGVYQMRGRILEDGPFPAYRYVGDWFITIAN